MPQTRRIVRMSAFRPVLVALALLLPAFLRPASAEPDAKNRFGHFVVNGQEAQLQHVRARWVPIDDEGTKGVAVLLSEEPAEGDIEKWRTAEPAKVGYFFHIIFDDKGDNWVAELGHTASKTGVFGVVLEVKKVTYEVKDGKVRAHVHTPREDTFGADTYTADLTFEAKIEDAPAAK